MLLKNGHLVDPTQAIDGVTDVRIEDGLISEVGPDLAEKEGEVVYDLKDKYILPGLIDTHVHFRDPGKEEAEDIESGAKAAIHGGFTTVVTMPNTQPVIDSVPLLTYVQKRSKDVGYADVLQTAAITKEEKGQEITEIGMLHEAGAIAFTEDGRTVKDTGVMRKAMDYGKPYDVLFMSHCEDVDLKDDGVMNEGQLSMEMGLKGIANEVEDIIIVRDIMLANLTKTRLHISHLSTKSGLEIIKQAKAAGVDVTCEVTPHHLFLTEDYVTGYNTYGKVAPPLRTREDNEALIKGLKDGSVDCIGTDHAPHVTEHKECEFDRAANGIASIEVALPLIWTKLYETGTFTLSEIVQFMSVNAAKRLRLEKGSLMPGKIADILVVDPTVEKEVSTDDFYSKAKNCPYVGERLTGWPDMVFRAGELVLDKGCIVEK